MIHCCTFQTCTLFYFIYLLWKLNEKLLPLDVGKRAISCAATPFCIAHPTLLQAFSGEPLGAPLPLKLKAQMKNIKNKSYKVGGRQAYYDAAFSGQMGWGVSSQ